MNLQDFARAYVAQCTEEDLEKDAASVKGIIAGAKKVGKKVLTKVKKPAKAVAAKTKAVAKKAGKKVQSGYEAATAWAKKSPKTSLGIAAGVGGAAGFAGGRASKKSAPEAEKTSAAASMFKPFGSSLKKMWGGVTAKGKGSKGSIGKAWTNLSSAEKASLIGMGGTAAAGAGGVALGRATKND